MGWLMSLGLAAARRWLRGLVQRVDGADVAAARERLECAIQARRRLPGTVRRWLCQEVRRVEAPTVDEWRRLLLARIDRL